MFKYSNIQTKRGMFWCVGAGCGLPGLVCRSHTKARLITLTDVFKLTLLNLQVERERERASEQERERERERERGRERERKR